MMSSNGRCRRLRTWSLGVGATLALAAGCGRGTSSPPEELGVARVAITQAPSDTRCVRITVAGSRTVTSSIDVMPGESTVAMLTGLALGDDTFSGDAFSVACAQVTPMNVAVWVGDPVVATVVNNPPVDVTLIMHRNGRANVGVDFQDDGAGGAMGVGGAMGTGGTMGGGGAMGVGGASGGPITFGPPLTIAIPEPVVQMISADLNGDGVGDVVWSTAMGGIFTATSNGPMLSGIRLLARVGGPPTGMVAVDLNGDGLLDLVLAFASGPSNASALLQIPGGTFSLVTLPVLPPLTALAAGDVNGDGVVDLVATPVSGSLVVAPARLPVTIQVISSGIAGATDIALLSTPSGQVHNVAVLSSGGSILTSFVHLAGGPLAQGPTTPLSTPATSLDSADFNGDGNGDIAAASPAGVLLLFGNGGGGFSPPRSLAPVPAVGVVALDLNRDGLPDIAAVSPSSGLAFSNPGGGMFGGATQFSIGAPPATSVVAVVPTPGNRFPLVVAGANGTVLSALPNTSP
jgi:hypothetical protein